jgi:pimeloyl-ACP methyl ester carboxylesterase
MYVEVNRARFWVVEKGEGAAVLFFHFGLGDWRVFEPELVALSDQFRCIAYDRRFFGRTEAPDEPYGPVDDAITLLDALEVERVALVGLSGGGGLALDVAYAHPERVTALVHIAAPVTGLPLIVSPKLEAAYAAAKTLEQEIALDMEVWAPLGVEAFFLELRVQAPAGELPEAMKRPPVMLENVRVPTLVVIAKRDPHELSDAGREAARRIPDARLVEVDSDHYLTLREPELITGLIRDFLRGA